MDIADTNIMIRRYIFSHVKLNEKANLYKSNCNNFMSSILSLKLAHFILLFASVIPSQFNHRGYFSNSCSLLIVDEIFWWQMLLFQSATLWRTSDTSGMTASTVSRCRGTSASRSSRSSGTGRKPSRPAYPQVESCSPSLISVWPWQFDHGSDITFYR